MKTNKKWKSAEKIIHAFLRYANDLRYKIITLILRVEGNTLKHPEDEDIRFL